MSRFPLPVPARFSPANVQPTMVMAEKMLPIGQTQQRSAMQTLILYAITTVIFLGLDAVMLKLHMQPLFQRFLGDQLLTDIRIVPAALFYLAYVAGLVYLVSYPALKTGSATLIPAAIIGAMAYGTYEFTSYAIMKSWSPILVMNDLAWGTVLTALSAWAGVALTRAFTA